MNMEELAPMRDYDSLKKSIDDVFKSNLQSNGNEQNVLPEEKFEHNLIPATADGESVNFGKYGGLIARIKTNRSWLVGIHCVAHRSELSIKDSLLKVKEFKKLDEMMIGGMYNLLKKSGKLKRSMKNEANKDSRNRCLRAA